jgi:predicted PurR-regulated permease PerM
MAEEPDAWRRQWPPLTYWVQVTVAVVLTFAVLVAARSVGNIIVLVIIAVVLAVGLEPAVTFLGRWRIKRGMATTIIFLAIVLFVILFAILLFPPLIRQIREFAAAVPGYIDTLDRRQDWIGRLARQYDVSDKIQGFIKTLPSRVGSSFSTILGLAGTIVGRVFEALTVGILTIYFMLSMPRLRRTAALLVAPPRREQAERVIEESLLKIGGYVSGNLITSAVCGTLTIIALVIIGVPYAVPLGMWAGVADLIPQVGSYLGAIPAVLVGLFSGPVEGVAVLLYFIAYQQFENYLLVPRVMSKAIDLSPAAVIISTLIGASLLGFAGALLALPVAATVKVVIGDLWMKDRLAANDAPGRRLPSEKADPRPTTSKGKGGAGL